MKCQYEYQVRAQCPVVPTDTDLYQFTIESEHLIEVEKIRDFFDKNAGKKETFQEVLTQQCAVTLGAKVRSEGWHGGIKVICHAP
jgi:hypothetical protein